MKTFSTTTLFTILFILFFSTTNAQTFPYVFVAETDTYTDLQEAEELTSVGDQWDDPTFIVPIGFDFEFYGNTYNMIRVGGLGNFLLFDDIYTADTLDFMIPYLDDLADIENADSNSQSTISYTTEGTIGERIFKVEWKDAGFFNEVLDPTIGTANNRISFQVWIYETSNNIEYRFGPSTIPDPTSIHDYGSPVCGIMAGFNIDPITDEQAFDAFWYLAGDPTNPTVELGDVSDVNNYSIDGLNAHPADGQVYRFINPAASIFSPDENSLSLKVYPNLVEDNFYVEVDQDILKEKTQMIILNQFGQEVMNQTLTDSKEILNASNLASGVYYLSILNKEGRGTEKFVKQ